MLHKKTLLFAMFSIALWSSSNTVARADVVASVKPLGFIVSAITDGVTPAHVLLPDGASEHDYALRPSDIKRLQKAELTVWIGPEMEAFMAKPVSRLPERNTLSIAALESVKPLLIKGQHDHDKEFTLEDEKSDHKHHEGVYNMHLWLSPEIARLAAVAIHQKLVELMPENKNKLDANLLRFESELTKTDKKLASTLLPFKGEGYYVFHDAWGYYEQHYGLTPSGHFTVNPEIQPGAQRLHEIRTQLVEHKVQCVFAEPQFRPAVIEAVARGTQVRMGTLDPLGTSIALGKDSYMQFLTQVAEQYADCLKGE